jgi:signal transduction histidine kinase
MALSLKTDGHNVTESANGVEALDAMVKTKAIGNPFDLLVCDIQMPVMTGEELLAKLKELRATLPTIVITGYGEKELLIRLMRLGCSDFVDKPFEPMMLCNKVESMLADSKIAHNDTVRRERLAIIGEKTIHTAHDLNNMLGGVIGYADRALDDLEPDHPIRKRLEKLIAESSRAAQICKGLLDNYRNAQDSFLISTEINSLVARVCALLQDIAPGNIMVTAATLAHPIWLKADAERIQQALLNLGFNAFEAMGNNGVLFISITEADAVRPSLPSYRRHCVILSVGDTGNGFPPDKQNHPFDDGSTSRKGGYGLGLNIVRKIVEQEHNGWISVESSLGKGTKFTLYFPTE